jgi:hypothetical protein
MGITHHLSFAALAPRRRGGLIATAVAIFALGFGRRRHDPPGADAAWRGFNYDRARGRP